MDKRKADKIVKERTKKIMNTEYITCPKCSFVITKTAEKSRIIKEVKRICNRLARIGSGDIAYGELIENLDKIK